MKEDEAYLEIAKRFIESCDKHILNNIDIQEVIGFKTYHAFESLGGAFNSHYGHTVSRDHTKKINAFVTNSRRNTLVSGHNIAIIAMLVSSMRNKYLYPEPIGASFKNPKNQISLTDAKLMVKKVKGILKQVENII
ncbi:hypothetical protein CMU94_09710 [Elizabethkingia anophelis]|nr:hypothetical protein [Elizabethkingia anophelis]